MGQGTVKNVTDMTNRDINNAQEITRDQTTGMLDGSVTVDHRLLTDDGRKEIIQDHKDVANAVKDTVAVVDGIIESRDFIKNYESSTQNMTIDEKNTLDNLLQSLQVESKDNTSTWVLVATEGVAIAGSTCARVPACVSAVVNLFGAATASAILNSEEEKKETHPKGVPSTSGSSATGMPPNDDDPKDSNISFGENSNQLHHTWRHVDKIGLPRSQVQDAIQKDILKRNISKLEIQKPHNFNTVVNGRKIQYTVYRINSTETRIQRIHGVP